MRILSDCKLWQRVQNTAARLVTRSDMRDRITPVLLTLRWLPVDLRIQYKIMVYTFKCLHEQAPSYISELVKPYTQSRTLRSANECRLTVPKFSGATYGSRRFDVAAATLWNSLPLNLRLSPSINSFKWSAKQYLFGLFEDRNL